MCLDRSSSLRVTIDRSMQLVMTRPTYGRQQCRCGRIRKRHLRKRRSPTIGSSTSFGISAPPTTSSSNMVGRAGQDGRQPESRHLPAACGVQYGPTLDPTRCDRCMQPFLRQINAISCASCPDAIRSITWACFHQRMRSLFFALCHTATPQAAGAQAATTRAFEWLCSSF